MTYAINLTLLILLINMVIVFGSTMGVLSNQEGAVDQLTDIVNTRNAVATRYNISSILNTSNIVTVVQHFQYT
jgi:hypothetical protein